MTSREPFDQLPRLMRLSSENIYRLMHLSGNVDAWHEETLTDVLRAHLAGAQYKVVGKCPRHPSERRCREWDRTSVKEVNGSIELSTKQEEAEHGADMLMTLTDGDPDSPRDDDHEIRFLFQAKRVRLTQEWSKRDSNFTTTSEQFDKLMKNAQKYRAAAYYLLYVQEEDPHNATPGQCPDHTSPQDCATMLVEAEVFKEYFESSDKKDPYALLRLGRPLRCLPDDCQERSDKATIFERSKAFAGARAPVATSKLKTRAATDSAVSSTVINPVAFARNDSVSRSTSGDALVVLLGEPSPNGDGFEDGVGDQRRGRGWSPDYSAIDLREAARQWWVVSAERARTVRYLVAVGDHEVRACYKITGAQQVRGGRYKFDVEELDRASKVARRLTKKTNSAVRARKRGARNPITYITV